MRQAVPKLGRYKPLNPIATRLAQTAATFSSKPHRSPYRRDDGDSDDGGARRRRPPKTNEPGPEEARFQLHKSRGQHLLTNPRILDAIVRRADLRPTDTVLEIGPGTGNLTARLLDSAAHVVAVEIDHRMVDALRRRLDLRSGLTVITGDALKTQFPPFDICVANIPYGISSPLIAKLLFNLPRPTFRSATLLLQKDFAKRLLANAGDSEFNRLAANVGLVATVEFVMDVGKRNFVPCPKVDSAVVCIRPRAEIPVVDIGEWLAFTRTCFGTKNKTLGAIFKQKKLVVELLMKYRSNVSGCNVDEDTGNSHNDDDGNNDNEECSGIRDNDEGDVSELGVLREKIMKVLKTEGFDERRPSKMSSEEFLQLLQLFNQQGILFCTQRMED